MRSTIVAIALILLLAVAGREALWRFDHLLMQAAAASPSGYQVAEGRSMPEGSKMPYGSGVFLQSRWAVLHSAQSELAFAGYCSEIGANWQAERRLRIDCELSEGEPYVAGASLGGTAVEVSLRRKLAANKSVNAAAQGRPLPSVVLSSGAGYIRLELR
jgi:hypothetical protein